MRYSLFLATVFYALCLLACHQDSISEKNNNNNEEDTYVSSYPAIVTHDYIELDKIHQISRFRSGIGHDYSDDFEACRSMKHYFQPFDEVDWSTVKIFSPIDGHIIRAYDEWAGTKIEIVSHQYPDFAFSIFHINTAEPFEEGDTVVSGQLLGTHVGEETMSDIAVSFNSPDGRKLVSYFDVMPDSIFQKYKERNAFSRRDFIITEEERDNASLVCDGETFSSTDTLKNWVVLQ